jgi:biotin transport system substrate-specific component
MKANAETFPTLADTLWSGGNGLVRNTVLAIAGSIALWISAKIQVPFYPVPMTMQTFAVLVIGMAYGWSLAGATLLLYLVEGAAGLPVFAGTPERGIGIAYMIGPTGGYLIGFLTAAVSVGWLAERGWDRSPVPTLAAMLVGMVIIYLFGLVWLGSVVGWDTPVLAFGLTPFLPAEAFKIVLAVVVLPLAWRLARRGGHG